MKNLLLAMSLFTVLASCSSSKEDFIDNPTDKEISFELNGEKKTLKAYSKEAINLKEGNHTLKTPTGDIIEFKKESYDENSIINPTKSQYIILTEVYSDTEKASNPAYEMLFKNVKIDDKTYFAPISIVDDYYISKVTNDWKFGLDEPFSETIDISQSSGSSYNLMIKKIFRKKEFIKEYADLAVED